jgi:hypothetical protein
MEYYDPNPMISGFSTCYIELALFSETQEFLQPPQIPVTVTFSKTVQQTKSYEELSDNDARALCAKKKFEYLRKINCLALFLLSPLQNSPKDLEFDTILNRYSWISRCVQVIEYHTLDDTNYEKHTYVTVVNLQNKNGGYSYAFGKSRRLPIFYYTIGNSSIKIGVELLAPCRFQATMDLPAVGITRETFDKVYSLGQKTNCSEIVWTYQDSTIRATTRCVSIGESTWLYEDQSSTILSILSKPFFNSTAFYWDWNGDRGTDGLSIEMCNKIEKEADYRHSWILATGGYAVAGKSTVFIPPITSCTMNPTTF